MKDSLAPFVMNSGFVPKEKYIAWKEDSKNTENWWKKKWLYNNNNIKKIHKYIIRLYFENSCNVCSIKLYKITVSRKKKIF